MIGSPFRVAGGAIWLCFFLETDAAIIESVFFPHKCPALQSLRSAFKMFDCSTENLLASSNEENPYGM